MGGNRRRARERGVVIAWFRRATNLAAGFLVSRRTLVAAVEQRTRERDRFREHALQAIGDRDAALREVCAVRAERDVARRLAADLAQQSGFAATLADIEGLDTTGDQL